MKHLTDGNAADLVRGLAAAKDRRWMEKHLESGCARCRESVAFLRSISVVTQADAQWEPPADIIERALDIFPERRPRVAPLRRRLLARLMYDSFREPLPAGIRAGRGVSRQVLYRAGDFFLDLRLDYEQGAGRASLVGQVAARIPEDLARTKVPSASVSVLLMDGRAVVAQAPLNRFGEFHLDYEPQPRLRLRVPLGAAQTGVELPLSRLLKPRTKARSGRSTGDIPARKT
jgi:hypothetical protein